MVKTPLTVFLFLTLLLPFGSTYLLLPLRKELVKREVRERLAEEVPWEGVTLLKFSRAETRTLLRWEHDREFEYRGQMYDIISVTERGDSIWYKCFHDRAETELNRKQAELLAHTHTPQDLDTSIYTQLFSFLRSLYLNHPPVLVSLSLLPCAAPAQQDGYLERLQAAPPVPPPEV